MQVYVYTLSFGSLCAHRSVNPRGNASAYTPAKPETVATPDKPFGWSRKGPPTFWHQRNVGGCGPFALSPPLSPLWYRFFVRCKKNRYQQSARSLFPRGVGRRSRGEEAPQLGLRGRNLGRLEEGLIGRARVLLLHLVEEQHVAYRIDSLGRPVAEEDQMPG